MGPICGGNLPLHAKVADNFEGFPENNSVLFGLVI